MSEPGRPSVGGGRDSRSQRWDVTLPQDTRDRVEALAAERWPGNQHRRGRALRLLIEAGLETLNS